MARGDTGKWVARAGATGGGRAYKGRVATSWYLGIGLIVVLGLVSIGFSRYQYQHPTSAPVVQPAVGARWYAGISFDVCGTIEPVLPPNTAATGIQSLGEGVVQIAPTSAAYAGHHAVLGVLVAGYSGLVLTADTVAFPGTATYRTGETCPSGTPDAGKKGAVVVEHWPSFSSSTGVVVPGDPRALPLANGQLITVAFVPAATTLAKPPQSTIDAVLSAISGTPPTTTTTVPPSTTTTVPPSTTTSVPKTAKKT